MTQTDAGTLPPNARVRRAALDGEVTQLHRGHRYDDEGDAFAWDDDTTAVRHAFERRG